MRMHRGGKVCPLSKILCFFHRKSTKKYRIPSFITTFVSQKSIMDRLELIKQPISAEFEVFKQKFDASLQSSNPLLDEVIKFIKQRKGKMMRPMLALLMAKLFGEIGDSTYYSAISLELLHTASLVHDDVVDALFAEMKNTIIKLVAENPDEGEFALDLLMISKYFERIGDHATNIAEWVIYSVTGTHKEV